MIKTKVAIAIPTYNRLKFLKECIKSILNQTFKDFSIFVFDNASEEPIEKVLKEFSNQRIYLIKSEKHLSQFENFRRIENYSFPSEYLVVFHDDDTMHPKMLEIEVDFMDKHKDIIFVFSGFRRVYDNAIFKFCNIDKKKIKYFIYKNNYQFTKAIMSWLEFAFSSTMYRNGFFFSTDFNKFSDFNCLISLIEISKKGGCAFIDAPLMNYRIHQNQDWQILKPNYEEAIFYTLDFFRSNFPVQLNPKDKKLFNKYSLNFLIRSYADINKGFFDFLRFLQKCRQKKIFKYSYFKYLDLRGFVSLVSILLKNKKIINLIRKIKDYFRK